MNRLILVGDFETTVYDGQEDTEVWASAFVPMHTEDVVILHSMEEALNYLKSLDRSLLVYYHNLKFDGAFYLNYLLSHNYKQACTYSEADGHVHVEWKDDKDMKANEFKYVISDMGQWYSITMKLGQHLIELRDSLKLLPFSVKEIGKSFKTKHQKLEMEYKGRRYAGCEITDEEKKYIANDVLVVKEALETMYKDGHDKMTIGACCLSEYKNIFGKEEFKNYFPDLTQTEVPIETPYPNIDRYIRKSYKGGWCYVVKGKENQLKYNGVTADVNSLYPSMMHSMSGNCYPVGLPKFWKGDYIPDEALKENMYFFIRVKTRFYIKPNHLPFIQIKGKYQYKGTECLETSDVFDPKTGIYYKEYIDKCGDYQDGRVELTFTCTDFRLALDHYELVDFEILDGCYFHTAIGIFDEYINKYAKIKMENKGALRTEAKLFLNNLYGKFASSDDSSFKYARLNNDGALTYINVPAREKKVGYIPIGAAITSYARNFTIRAAQANYYGTNERGFIYADTDSIHCDLKPEEIKGITVHDKNFCCWKLESSWDVGIFARQKTYIEHVVAEDLEPIEEPYFNVKCAGMPKRCKDLFVKSFEPQIPQEELQEYTEDEQEFLKTHRTIEDFKQGLVVPGKLIPHNIKGGVLLVETSYEMR